MTTLRLNAQAFLSPGYLALEPHQERTRQDQEQKSESNVVGNQQLKMAGSESRPADADDVQHHQDGGRTKTWR